ncbi:DUF6452 family protein [Flavobacterium sp. DG1-102-2]|uniref:DUF6452 family protein n=1 Tax=Flavobacterium sp. DG1-102-2 TaxID=3081663 RepID=UPI002948D2DF|nr:DUF6452 family protein [Flavobacterium sp. DG1-102-2]MDV6166986.1 DUF6452 family protein [Flavobacterium sp. DG1-102-2]
MKRLVASIAVLLIVSAYLLSCEKDDLCADGSPITPQLVVNFYQRDNTTQVKRVSNFKVYIEGTNDTLPFRRGDSLIKMPLKNDADKVKWTILYRLAQTGADSLTFIDDFEISYKRTQTYVSRACGFRNTFLLDPENTPNPVITHHPENPGTFISDKNIINPNVENENEAHINIYF